MSGQTCEKQEIFLVEDLDPDNPCKLAKVSRNVTRCISGLWSLPMAVLLQMQTHPSVPVAGKHQKDHSHRI